MPLTTLRARQPSALPGALRLLVVDRSAATARTIRRALELQPAIRVQVARGPVAAARLIEREAYDAILIDDQIWTDGQSRVGTLVRQRLPDAAVIVLTDEAGGPAVHLGVHDSIERSAIAPGPLMARLDAAVAETRGARRRETLVRWLEREARTDRVTGLASKSAFDEALREACQESDVAQTPVTLIQIHLDTGGEGDEGMSEEALRRTAAGVSRAVRALDFTARVGDAFSVILHDAGIDLGRRVARRICQEVDRLNSEAWPDETRVLLCFGVASAVGPEPVALVEAAEEEILSRRPRSMIPAATLHTEHGRGPSVA